jgi:hypothetical protein
LGDPQGAAEFYRQAAEIFRAAGDEQATKAANKKREQVDAGAHERASLARRSNPFN